MTENYPPFNFIDNGKLEGISVDLMVLMLKKLNYEQSRDSIRLLPWTRGYQNLLKKKNTCLFATTRIEEREKLFKWVGPISSTTISLIARKDKKIKINSVKDIMKYKIGVVRDDIGEQLLINAGIELKKLDRLESVDATLMSIKKLNKDRIEVWSYEENVAKWEIKRMGFNPDEYEIVYILKKGELYYAFHIDTPNSLIQKFQTALDELKKDGTHQKILDKYLK
jgi:polar amino acid transport system substrate-binding protein